MDPEEEINLLQAGVDELLRGIQDVLMSGEILSDEFQGILAQELEATLMRIDQLSAENPVEGLPAGPIEQPQMTEAMPSSNVEGFAYDDKTQRLLVRFLGKHPNRNGPIYGYEGVPKEIFQLFQSGSIPARTDGSNRWGKWWKGKVPSIGASLYTLIKNSNYPYQKLT